jgi:glycosyltransferase involved in cell wall biosynthesis/ubiquinone/menaquinone biosynthesis C-methylase UbiE
MKVWLIQIGEPLPLQPGVRKMRTGLLADHLVDRGHRVRWWVSAFEHQRKVMLSQNEQEVPLSPGLTLQVLHGCGYSSNISPVRYLDHRLVARKFRQKAPGLQPPEVIVTSMPCHHLAFEAVSYARRRNIPVLVDIRDLWPDVLLANLPNIFSDKLGHLALHFDFRRLRALLREADGLIAVSRGYLKWALEKAERGAGEWDRVFLLGYKAPKKAPIVPESNKLPEWLQGQEGKKLLLFIGTFGFSYELRLLVEAARRMESAGRKDVCFILAGTGEQAGILRRESAGLSNVLLPGWLDAPEIGSLLAHGYLGLVPYACEKDRLPNKPFEYLSAGLPLISSLEGEMAELISDYGLGLNYHPGNLDGLCLAIESLLDNRDLRDQMSAHALAFFNEYGDADKIYAEYAGHMESLAKSKTIEKKKLPYHADCMNNILQDNSNAATPELHAGLAAGGAARMWEGVLRDALGIMREIVPGGSRVLEVGYGDGLLSCYLGRQLGWSLTGLESSSAAHHKAMQHAERFDLARQVKFRYCAPEETHQHRGQYDAVFIKTVLYNSRNLEEYSRWLDWILSVLRPGGIFINFETGRANVLTQYYRRLRGRSYTNLCLYTRQVEALYDARFEIVDRRYYGGWSQFLAPVPGLYFLASRIEEALQPRHADNSFIVSIIARRPG